MSASGVELTRKSLDFVEGSLRPLGDRIIVKPMPLKLSATLITDYQGKYARGMVVAVGPGEYPNVYNENRSKRRPLKAFRKTEVKVGDIVELGSYTFPEVMLNGERHLIASEKDVCGIVNGSS
jgi:co-chaperonin GroES (HSP10)